MTTEDSREPEPPFRVCPICCASVAAGEPHRSYVCRICFGSELAVSTKRTTTGRRGDTAA